MDKVKQFGKRLSQVRSKNQGADAKWEEFLSKLAQVHEANPDNLCAKHLTKDLFLSYKPQEREILYKCCLTGVENPDSSLGAYAMTPKDYTTFKKFFDPLIREYHGAKADAKHVTDWNTSGIGKNGVLDLAELGLSEVSMRVRVGRNLTQFNLPGNMTKEERIKFEQTMLAAFSKLIAMKEYGGRVYSLTPNFGKKPNPNLITDAQYQDLVDRHIMFKDMDADPFLKSAGISNDWPYGRGCYVSADEQFIIWFGEEDQLRIMCMMKGTKLNEVFDRLRKGLEVVESINGIKFATSEDYGYVTSCPSNLGTGMRASVHIKLPNLTKDGTDTKAKAVAKPLGLSVRGIGGEHTPIGADGTVDISPRARLFIREKDIIAKLYEGIKLLMEEEKKAGGGKASAPSGQSTEFESFLKALEAVHKENPDNLAAKHLTRKLFLSFPPEKQKILYKCALTGVENPTSSIGAYAMTPTDYTVFRAFFDPLIREYHGASPTAKHVTDWDISDIGNKGVLDVSELGLDALSMRVRVGRNLKQFNLPGNMTKSERIKFEKTMLKAFAKLIAMEEYGGQVYSLTPDFEGEKNPNLITDKEYQELVDRHIMFKNMDDDPFLKSAGISNDWPYGRGCYVSADNQFIVWFGEEDQLRIMCMKVGTKLNEVFGRLREGLDTIESIDGIDFATSEDYGYVTSCPSNLGTGMRASVHVKLPNLTKDGTDTKAKAVAKPLGLSVRGIGGEHTPIGADGTVDISPRSRLFIREKDIIVSLYEGIKLLMAEEKKA